MKIINLGKKPYWNVLEQMKKFTIERNQYTEDELWIVEHHSVITQGISGKNENVLSASDIPIINTDRGGQVTYHGPGQLIIYCLIDIKRINIGVRKMVSIIENSIINLLSIYGIDSHLIEGSPGVYVDNAKIAALGLKIKKGRTYHGLSINVDMDLSPFLQINPCGYKGMNVTQLCDLTDNAVSVNKVAEQLSKELSENVTRN